MLNIFKLLNIDLSSDADAITDTLLNYFQPSELQEQFGDFDQLYVFGDSLSDIGNTFDLTQQALGEGLPPAPPYFSGRFSNGPVWVEYLARFLNLTSDRHTNFATGGATTGSTNTFMPDTPNQPKIPAQLPGLQQQLEQFIALLQGAQADPKDLYIVWAGANDYLGGGIKDPTVPVENLSNAIKSLVNVGARQIMVVNLPDLGDLPGSREDSQISAGLNALTQAHNAALATALQTMQQTVCSEAAVMLFDVNALLNQALADPAAFGFTNSTDAEMIQLAQFQGFADKFFFWDIIHPTTSAHLTLAQAAASVLTSTTVPALQHSST